MRFSYKNALNDLTEYAVNEGYAKISLEHHDISTIQWTRSSLNEPKSIEIEGKHTWEIKTYFMLHELGHHVLRKNWNRFKKRFPVSAHAEDSSVNRKDYRFKRRISYVVSSLEEEYCAWNEGYKLGVKLGIKINEEKWINLKSKCIKAYIGYYANLKG